MVYAVTLRRTTMPVGSGTEVEYRCRINVRENWNDTTQHKHEPTLPVGDGTEVQYCCRIKVRQKRTNADNTNMNLFSQPLQLTIQTNEMKTLTPFSLTNNDTELGCCKGKWVSGEQIREEIGTTMFTQWSPHQDVAEILWNGVRKNYVQNVLGSSTKNRNKIA